MNNAVNERRRLSRTGLLDSAIRTLSLLATTGDLRSRALVNQALGNLQQLRREFPTRREHDR